MPELPEVETIAGGLNRYLRGKAVAAATADTPKLFPNDPALTAMHLIGSRVESVTRRGKAMLITLSSGYVLVIHLKMTGQLVFAGKGQESSLPEPMPGRFTHVIFTFADGSHLYFNDQRKFGWIRLMPATEAAELKFLKEMGPEPLTSAFNAKYLKEKLSRRQSSPIKTALLDQKVVAGVGNIYADESLFLSGILPNRPAAGLKEKEIRVLCANIKKVLRTSIELGGSSRQDYVNAIGQKGDYLDQAYVYGRTGEPCRTCGRPIEKIKLAGRGTHFCRGCQK